jgi:hypothetical protein
MSAADGAVYVLDSAADATFGLDRRRAQIQKRNRMFDFFHGTLPFVTLKRKPRIVACVNVAQGVHRVKMTDCSTRARWLTVPGA